MNNHSYNSCNDTNCKVPMFILHSQFTLSVSATLLLYFPMKMNELVEGEALAERGIWMIGVSLYHSLVYPGATYRIIFDIHPKPTWSRVRDAISDVNCLLLQRFIATHRRTEPSQWIFQTYSDGAHTTISELPLTSWETLVIRLKDGHTGGPGWAKSPFEPWIGVMVTGGTSRAGIERFFNTVSWARKQRMNTATYAGCWCGDDVSADCAIIEDELSGCSALDRRHC